MSELTKLALEEALKEMLLKKPLDKIRISDLTDACGVSRMTFYYHFQDLYDLVEWSCEHDAAKAIGSNRTYETWQEGFLYLFEEVKKNEPFILNVYHCQDMRQIIRYLNRMTYPLLYNVADEFSADYAVREEDKEFIAGFYSHGFVGAMLDWIEHGMKDDPKQIIEELSTILSGSIPRALAACQVREEKNGSHNH